MRDGAIYIRFQMMHIRIKREVPVPIQWSPFNSNLFFINLIQRNGAGFFAQ